MSLTSKITAFIIALLCCQAHVAWAIDSDGDGVDDALDVCPDTPPGTSVDANGRPLGDVDGDCDTDLDDHALFLLGFTGPLLCVPDCAGRECGDDLCDGSCGTCLIGSTCVAGLCISDCTNNGDCDDGLFCNGAEICTDIGTDGLGNCAAGSDPCALDEICDEMDDQCICDAIPQTLVLTTATDVWAGTCADDLIDGSHFLTGGGIQVQTLNNADQLDGGLGNDTLTVQFVGGGTTTPANLASIETLSCEIIDVFDATLNALNGSSITTINNDSSRANLTVSNVGNTPTDIGMTNTNQNYTVTVTSSVLSGPADQVNLNLASVTVAAGEPIVTLQPSMAGSGFEIINVVSLGAIANNLVDLVDGLGTSFDTLNISGSQDFKIDNALNTSVTTVDGVLATGVIDLLFPVNDVTVTGGTNNDILRFGGNFDVNDTVDGTSGGNDILESTSANFTGTAVAQTNVTNIDTLRTTDALAGNLNVVHWGASNATIAGIDDNAWTITIPPGGTIELTADGEPSPLTVALAGTDTLSDAFTLRLNGTTSADLAGDVTATSFETMNLDCVGAVDAGDNTVQALTLNNTAAIESIILTGTSNLTVAGTIVADVLNGSAFTGDFNNVAVGANGAIQITTGPGADNIRGSAGADILDANGGNDRLQGDAGSDLLTGGSGNDTFDMDNIAMFDTDTITDFNAGTNTSSNDAFIWDISSLEAFAGVTDLVDTSANSQIAGNHTFIQLGSDGQTIPNGDMVGIIGDYTSAAAALAGRTSWTTVYGASLADNNAYLIAYTSGTNVRIALVVVNGLSSNSDSVDTVIDLAILQGVSQSNLNTTDFNSDF